MGTYETTSAGKIPIGSGPYRSRTSLINAAYELVVVLRDRAWRSTSVPLQHLKLEQQSINLLQIPLDIEKRLIKATKAFGLTFAGWDFKLTPDGQYWCLEANPIRELVAELPHSLGSGVK